MKNNYKEAASIAHYIHNWLHEYTMIVKGNSIHTIRSYSQTLSLYIKFLELERNIKILDFNFNCFSKENIEQWIIWLKQVRGCSSETCNVRLSSIKAFLKYLSGKGCSHLNLFTDASEVHPQKVFKRKINGISKIAVKALLSSPDATTKTGRRDLTLLILMYNTAIRIDELLSLRIKDLLLGTGKPSIMVIGKGRKIRNMYLLPKTVDYLKKYIKEFHANTPQDSYVFYSRIKGISEKMSQPSINKRLKKYAVAAHKFCNEIPETLHAHQIRHAKATHWLEDGMNIVQISFLLGHANIKTTMEYLDITAEQEQKALATLQDETQTASTKKWKNNKSTLSEFCGLGT